jgi:hypothetical protein
MLFLEPSPVASNATDFIVANCEIRNRSGAHALRETTKAD